MGDMFTDRAKERTFIISSDEKLNIDLEKGHWYIPIENEDLWKPFRPFVDDVYLVDAHSKSDYAVKILSNPTPACRRDSNGAIKHYMCRTVEVFDRYPHDPLSPPFFYRQWFFNKTDEGLDWYDIQNDLESSCCVVDNLFVIEILPSSSGVFFDISLCGMMMDKHGSGHPRLACIISGMLPTAPMAQREALQCLAEWRSITSGNPEDRMRERGKKRYDFCQKYDANFYHAYRKAEERLQGGESVRDVLFNAPDLYVHDKVLLYYWYRNPNPPAWMEGFRERHRNILNRTASHKNKDFIRGQRLNLMK